MPADIVPVFEEDIDGSSKVDLWQVGGYMSIPYVEERNHSPKLHLVPLIKRESDKKRKKKGESGWARSWCPARRDFFLSHLRIAKRKIPFHQERTEEKHTR